MTMLYFALGFGILASQSHSAFAQGFWPHFFDFLHHSKKTVDQTLTPPEPTCSPVAAPAGTSPITSPVLSIDAFDAGWDEYVKSTEPDTLQKDCVPQRRNPPSGVTPKGVVLFYHGLTACPQQWFKMADDLAAQGYVVLMPLLSGHGKKLDAYGNDDLSTLPDSGSWRKYQDLATRMNSIVSHFPGEKVVGGESLGGAISVESTELTPNLYNRQILFAPFFAAGTEVMSSASDLFRLGGRNAYISFGTDCSVLERNAPVYGGRAGYCGFQTKHFYGARSLGTNALEHATPSNTQTQIVGVEKDGAASTVKMQAYYSQISRQGKLSNVSGCFLPTQAQHSMVSPVDSWWKPKWWMKSLLNNSEDFIVNGKPLDSRTSDTKWLGRCADPGLNVK